MFIQNINRSTESTKREIAVVKKDTADVAVVKNAQE